MWFWTHREAIGGVLQQDVTGQSHSFQKGQLCLFALVFVLLSV